MFIEHFKITLSAVSQIFLLAAVGFFLVKRSFLSSRGLDDLSRLVMNIALPALIFSQLIRNFSFAAYPNWWIFPLVSIAVTLLGLSVGAAFLGFLKKDQEKLQFLSLAGFQNSGYLPLALISAIFLPDQLREALIYLFLFLMGFNLVIFSLGVYILNFHKEMKLKISSLFSAPVLATLFSLAAIYLGLQRFMPETLIKPLRMLADTTLPLAMLVVGGNLAQISIKAINKRAIALLIAVKLFILPLLGLAFIGYFKISGPIGLLILIQLAMPSAVTISTIVRFFKKEDILVSQGILITHIVSVMTIPVFLILYFNRFMIK